MLNFDVLGKDLGLESPFYFYLILQDKYFSGYTLLTDQTSLSDCLCFLRHVYCNYLFPSRRRHIF